MSTRHQVSEEQENIVHKPGEDSLPQALASHQHDSKPIRLRKSGRRLRCKSKARKSFQVSLEQIQGEINNPSSSTLIDYEVEEVKQCVSKERNKGKPKVEILTSSKPSQAEFTSKINCFLKMGNAFVSTLKGEEGFLEMTDFSRSEEFLDDTISFKEDFLSAMERFCKG